MTSSDGEFMTVREAAMALGVSATTAYRMVASREIPALVLRGRVRVPRAALRAWLEATSKAALASVSQPKARG